MAAGNLPLFKDDNQPMQLMQTRWKSLLDPVLANVLVQGSLLTNIALVSGVNTINHKLGRLMQGWIIVDRDGAATIYRSKPLSNTILTLTASASVNISLWVF